LKLPPLTNMNAGAPLGPYLFNRAVVKDLPPAVSTLDGQWIGELMSQVGEATGKAARILFKSLGGILALQDNVAADWHARRAGRTEGAREGAEAISSGEPTPPAN
jgi:hypothetical protein